MCKWIPCETKELGDDCCWSNKNFHLQGTCLHGDIVLPKLYLSIEDDVWLWFQELFNVGEICKTAIPTIS